MSERQQIVLKKKLEFATKSPKSKENTPLESTRNIGTKSLSPMSSPRRSPRFKTSLVEIVLDSPPPKIKKEDIPMDSPTKKVPSMVIRVKNATRVKNVPSKYEGFSTSLNWPKNSTYKLTKEEIDLLDKFWEDYYERFDYLVKVCISPNPERLKRLLSREWLDTGYMAQRR